MKIDLAHHPQQHHPMYSTSTMYGTNTGVTMSHPSQMTTFPPPPLFASNPVSHHNPPSPIPVNTSSVCSNNVVSETYFSFSYFLLFKYFIN